MITKSFRVIATIIIFSFFIILYYSGLKMKQLNFCWLAFFSIVFIIIFICCYIIIKPSNFLVMIFKNKIGDDFDMIEKETLGIISIVLSCFYSVYSSYNHNSLSNSLWLLLISMSVLISGVLMLHSKHTKGTFIEFFSNLFLLIAVGFMVEGRKMSMMLLVILPMFLVNHLYIMENKE